MKNLTNHSSGIKIQKMDEKFGPRWTSTPKEEEDQGGWMNVFYE
jgi:hypothetical protein